MPYSLNDALEKAALEKIKYQENLIGKTFAYAYIDRKNSTIDVKEVSFYKGNYLHLTGLDYFDVLYKKRVFNQNLPSKADEFFDRLGTDDTLINDISFIKGKDQAETNLNYTHTQDKLDNLPQISYIAKKAEFIGNYKDKTKFDLLINRKKESLALRKRGNVYIPVSSRYGNVQNFVEKKEINPVLAIFVKERTGNKYEIEYLNKDVKLNNNIRFASDILHKFNYNSFVPITSKLNNAQLEKLTNIYTFSLKQQVSKQLEHIGGLRERAFASEPDMNEYINATKIFRQNIDNKEMLSMAIAILKKDFEECPSADNKDLINDEINKLSELFPTSDGLVHIVKFENELPKGQAQDNALAVPLPKVSAPQPPNIFDKLRNIAQDIIKDFKKLLSEEPTKKNKTVSKTPQNKTKSSKAAQKKEPIKKPVERIQTEKVQEPEQKKARFCKADLKSEKYAPRSQKKDRSVSRKRNDLEH